MGFVKTVIIPEEQHNRTICIAFDLCFSYILFYGDQKPRQKRIKADTILVYHNKEVPTQ